VELEERFWSKVDRRAPDECWPWTRALGGSGYGNFVLRPGDLPEVSQRRYVNSHRLAFRLVHGRWPDPQALHGCDFRPCCNAESPEHIHEGTQADNLREMAERGRAVSYDHRANPAAAKLTRDQVAEIRRIYAEESNGRRGIHHRGVTYADLAERFGVHRDAIAKVVRRVTWQL